MELSQVVRKKLELSLAHLPSYVFDDKGNLTKEKLLAFFIKRKEFMAANAGSQKQRLGDKFDPEFLQQLNEAIDNWDLSWAYVQGILDCTRNFMKAMENTNV